MTNSDAKSDRRRTSKSIDLTKEADSINEQSPLLPARTSADVGPLPPLESVFSPSDSDNTWHVDDFTEHGQETRSSWYLFLLTLCMLGYGSLSTQQQTCYYARANIEIAVCKSHGPLNSRMAHHISSVWAYQSLY